MGSHELEIEFAKTGWASHAADQQKEKRVTHSVGRVILSINGKWGLCYIMGLRKAMAGTQGTLLGASYLDLPSPTVKVNVKQ